VSSDPLISVRNCRIDFGIGEELVMHQSNVGTPNLAAAMSAVLYALRMDHGHIEAMKLRIQAEFCSLD
jgi:hypothetical protein